jgi:hypothetical protein
MAVCSCKATLVLLPGKTSKGGDVYVCPVCDGPDKAGTKTIIDISKENHE